MHHLTHEKQWKRFFLVLRPNVLSVYKNNTEAKLLKQVNLNDITAVAVLKDPKGRRGHMFGVFSPSRNFHLQAASDADARAWVDLIKREARVDEDESMVYGSPPPNEKASHPIDHYIFSGDEGDIPYDRQISSSPEPMDIPDSYTTTRDGVRIPALRQGSHDQSNLDYSGPEQGSFSDYSDAGAPRVRKSVQIQVPESEVSKVNASASAANGSLEEQPRPSMGRNVSGSSAYAGNGQEDTERVIYHGWLLYLKTKGGVKQWKRVWAVLRPNNISFYKNEDEYSAQLIVPISSILSAVEIDAISKSKTNCMQIIAEEERFKFNAPSEEALARWLGAVRSQLAKRNQRRAQREGEVRA